MLRPRAVYRGLGYTVVGVLVLYAFVSIITGEDDGRAHKPSKTHLYITVSKDRVEHRLPKLAPKRILFWTNVFREPAKATLTDCPGLTDRCIFDHGRERIASADAVLFHMPDFSEDDIPDQSTRTPNQRYVFLSQEAPAHRTVRYNKLPKRFFNWTMTYLSASDVLFKYGSFWIDRKTSELRGFPKTDNMAVPKSLIKSRKPGVFWLVSHCNTVSKREQAFEALAKYYPVHIAGSCAKTQALRDLCPKGVSCDDVVGSYMFHVIAENTICDDYVTEKYWARWQLPSVPITMKRRQYAGTAPPPKSIIFMEDFAGPKEMADYLNYLQDNSTAYAEYFEWRNSGDWAQPPWNAPGYRNGYCRLCERLWEKEPEESTVEKVDMWFEAENKCEAGEFVRDWIRDSSAAAAPI